MVALASQSALEADIILFVYASMGGATDRQ